LELLSGRSCVQKRRNTWEIREDRLPPPLRKKREKQLLLIDEQGAKKRKKKGSTLPSSRAALAIFRQRRHTWRCG